MNCRVEFGDKSSILSMGKLLVNHRRLGWVAEG